MSWPLRHSLPAGLAAGLLLSLVGAGTAAACPAHNPCPASAGGYYGGGYQHSSGYSETYGYEQAYVSDGYGTRGYAQEYGPYRQDYGHHHPRIPAIRRPAMATPAMARLPTARPPTPLLPTRRRPMGLAAVPA